MITFAQFMENALYGPEGYYSSGLAHSGKSGDYFTAPDVSAVFGRLLYAIFEDWKKRLEVRPFHLVEIGAGEGALARAMGEALPNTLPDRFDEIRYTAVDSSPARQELLSRLSDDFLTKGILFHVLPSLAPLGEFPVEGVFFANELIDAFPVHRVRWQKGSLQEAFVENEKMVWKSPSTPALQQYFMRLKIDLPDGYETEVNLAQKQWLQQAASALKRGLIVLMDYGRPAYDYYAPERSGGTLRAFRHHQVSTDWLAHPGTQDLTADVDFTSLALDAREAGLEPLGFMELGSFLMQGMDKMLGSGLALLHQPAGVRPDRSSDPSDATMQDLTPARALQLLIHPDGMGASFHVLILGKGLDPEHWTLPHNRIARLGLPKPATTA